MVREADGATVRVTVGGWRAEGRVTFRGCWPKFRDGTFYSGGASESITCSQAKSPKNLAKEVVRRLLPAYEVAYARALEYVQKHDRNGREAEMVASRIAGALGLRVGENRYRNGGGVHLLGEPDCVRRVIVQPGYDGHEPGFSRPVSVQFEVHGLDPETAIKVLEIIQESERKRVGEALRVQEEASPSDEEGVEVTRVRKAVMS
jgi:hypothetical protein